MVGVAETPGRGPQAVGQSLGHRAVTPNVPPCPGSWTPRQRLSGSGLPGPQQLGGHDKGRAVDTGSGVTPAAEASGNNPLKSGAESPCKSGRSWEPLAVYVSLRDKLGLFTALGRGV